MRFKNVEALMKRIRDSGVPGNCIIIRHAGQEVFRCTGGINDSTKGEPFTPDLPCYVFSISKLVTCIAALQLYEKGLYLLDEPVKAFLPEFARMRVRSTLPNGDIVQQDAQMDMTVRHLFTMTSGLSYELHTPSIESVRKQPHLSTREGVRAIASEPLLFEPGTHWHYGLSHDVLGALIEVWSGMTFGDYIRQNILEPIGMNHTGFHKPLEGRQLAVLYGYDSKEKTTHPIPPILEYEFAPGYESGGAGLVSTAEDMALFADMLSNCGLAAKNERILSAGTVLLMRQDQLDTQQKADFRWIPGYSYGLGVRTVINAAAAGVPPMAQDFGWGGAAGAYLLADPSEKLSCYYSQHVLYGNTCYDEKIRNTVYADFGRD